MCDKGDSSSAASRSELIRTEQPGIVRPYLPPAPPTRPWKTAAVKDEAGARIRRDAHSLPSGEMPGYAASPGVRRETAAFPADRWEPPAAVQNVEYISGVALSAGDVLAAARLGGLYEHFAIYTGNGRVIHYAAPDGDFGGVISVHEADFAAFERGTTSIAVLDFPSVPGQICDSTLPGHVPASALHESGFFAALRGAFYHLYSPAETVARARKRLGETRYSLPFNNCEHLAVWCKTGVHESRQVNRWMTLIGKWIASAR